MTIADKVKLVVVHRGSPDIETEVGTFPSKDAAMHAFRDAIAKHDPLRARIEPIEAEATVSWKRALRPLPSCMSPARAGCHPVRDEQLVDVEPANRRDRGHEQ
jgi:hypothetical protein